MTDRRDATTTGNAPEAPRAQESATRRDILNAAATLIVEEGYAGCTMRSLSERVNIKAGSLYYHFASKDEIVGEILNIGVTMLLEAVTQSVEALPAGTPLLDRIHVAVEAHIRGKVDPNVPYMQVYEHLPPVMKRRSREMRHTYAEFWVALFREGQASGVIDPDVDLAVFVPFFLGGLNRVPEWFNHARMDPARIARVIAASFLDGIARPA